MTRPFTAGADLAVAVGFVPIAALVGASLGRRRHLKAASKRHDATEQRRLRPFIAWAIVVTCIVAFELAAYFAGFGNRHAFPTLSSLYDEAASHIAAKAFLVFVWLALGVEAFRP